MNSTRQAKPARARANAVKGRHNTMAIYFPNDLESGSGCYIMSSMMSPNLIKFGETTDLYQRWGKAKQRFARCAGFDGAKGAKEKGWNLKTAVKVEDWIPMPESTQDEREAFEDKIREALESAGAVPFIRIEENNNNRSEHYLIPVDLMAIEVDGILIHLR